MLRVFFGRSNRGSNAYSTAVIILFAVATFLPGVRAASVDPVKPSSINSLQNTCNKNTPSSTTRGINCESSCGIQPTGRMTLPSFQYIDRPGADITRSNAIVAVLRTRITF